MPSPDRHTGAEAAACGYEPGRSLLRLVPGRRLAPELLDLPPDEQDSRVLQESLMDIRRVNLRLGGTGSAIRELEFVLNRLGAVRAKRAVAKTGAERHGGYIASVGPKTGVNTARGGYETGTKEAPRLRILDVAAGSADITSAMANYAENKGYKVFSVAADLNPAALVAGRYWNRIFPGISYVSANGLMLPFSDKSFDIVHCSLVLHHLSCEDAVKFMAEMARVSKFAIIIGDLRRNIIPWALIWILTRLFTANRYTRYDGPLSVLKSFTFAELKRLGYASGLRDFRVRRRRFWRMSIVGFV